MAKERLICKVCGKPRMSYVQKDTNLDIPLLLVGVGGLITVIAVPAQSLALLVFGFSIVGLSVFLKFRYEENPANYCEARPELGEWCPEATKKADPNDIQEYARKVAATRVSLEEHYTKEINVSQKDKAEV